MLSPTYPRREYLLKCGLGLGALGLTELLAKETFAAQQPSDRMAIASPLQPKSPHFPTKAKHVIHIFANVGPSQYGYIDRQNLPGMFRTFDFPNPDASSSERFRTTVPQQALYLMNNHFVAEQADKIATQVADLNPDDAVERLYTLLFQRLPTESERKLGIQFLAEAENAELTRYTHMLLLTNELFFLD